MQLIYATMATALMTQMCRTKRWATICNGFSPSISSKTSTSSDTAWVEKLPWFLPWHTYDKRCYPPTYGVPSTCPWVLTWWLCNLRTTAPLPECVSASHVSLAANHVFSAELSSKTHHRRHRSWNIRTRTVNISRVLQRHEECTLRPISEECWWRQKKHRFTTAASNARNFLYLNYLVTHYYLASVAAVWQCV